MTVLLKPYSQYIRTGFWKYFDKQAALFGEDDHFMMIDKQASSDWPYYKGTADYPECIFKTRKAKYELTRRGLFVTPHHAGRLAYYERFPLADYFLVFKISNNKDCKRIAIAANKNHRESVRIINIPSSLFSHGWIRKAREENIYITREKGYLSFFYDYVCYAVYKEIELPIGLINHSFAKILLQEQWEEQ